MNILYLVHQFYPRHYAGTERFVLNLSSTMKQRGHTVNVGTYSFNPNSYYDHLVDGILLKRSFYNDVPLFEFKYEKYTAKERRRLFHPGIMNSATRLLKRLNPDVIHVGHPMRVSPFIFAARKLQIPYIITLTDFYFFCARGILINSQGCICEGAKGGKVCETGCPEFGNALITSRWNNAQKLLFSANSVVAPSEFVASMFRKEFEGLQVTVIPHGIPDSYVQERHETEREKKLTIGYAGTLKHHKGVHLLIRAFRQLTSSHICLKIYGSGVQEEYVRRLKDLAGEDERIEFCGVYSENEIGKIFSQFDVLVVPSIWYENYPLVLHEALRCGVPVVASDAGGMAEKIQNGFNGFTFPLGNMSQLKNKLNHIIEQPEILIQLRENVRRMNIPTLEWEADAYESLYHSVE